MVGIHSEDCRARIEKAIAVKEPERFERVNQVLTKLQGQDEGNPVESEERNNPVLKRARTRLEESRQQQQQQQPQQQQSSSSGISEEDRKVALQGKKDEEMRMSDEVIKRSREQDDEEGLNSSASKAIRGERKEGVKRSGDEIPDISVRKIMKTRGESGGDITREVITSRPAFNP